MTVNFENRLALNPAIIVGLGGTGKKVLMNFKETFMSHPTIREIFKHSDDKKPVLPDFINLFCVDTDLFNSREEEKFSGTRLAEEEYHQINIQNANQITGNLDTETYSYLNEWFPVKLKNHIGQISQGAHQFRFTGRFGLFVDMNRIYQTLKTKISKIMARKNVNQDDLIVPLTDKQGQIKTPEFYIIGSICGGSGAGMLLDIAYLLKMAYYQLSGGRGKPTMVGILANPEAFTQIAIDPNINPTGRIEANGYASLAEIFYYMYKEKFPKTKTAKDILKQDRRNKFMVNFGPVGKSHDSNTFGAVSEETAFDQCYLIGTSNLDDINTYFSIAAEFIFTKLATNLGEKQNSMLDNASQVLGQLSSDLEGKQLKCFSSIGYKSFFYPVDIIIDLYTYKLSMDLTYWLKLSIEKISIDQMVNEFVESNPNRMDLTPDGLLIMAKEIISRKKYWDNPQYHTFRSDPAQQPGESGVPYLRRKLEEMDKTKVRREEILKKVQIEFERRAIEIGKYLKEKIIEIIGNPDLGAYVAVDFLNAFEKFLNRFPRDTLARKDEELKGKLLKEQREYVALKNEFSSKVGSFFNRTLMELGNIFSSSGINEEFNRIEKQAMDAVELEYERFCLSSVSESFLKFVVIQSQTLKKQVEEFCRKLDIISKDGIIERSYESCLEKIKPYSKVSAFVRTFIFEDRDIEPFYKYLLGELTNNDIEGEFLVNINLGNNWDAYTNPNSSSLEQDIVAYCRKIIAKRMFGGIEEFIHWKDSVKKGFKRSLFESMMNQATPLITINERGNNQPARMNIVTLGIFNENSKLTDEIKESLRKADINVAVAPTRNPYEISLVQTLHGICPYNLSSITQWQALYRRNHAKINCHAVLTNDAYPVLWSSYGLIPAKTLENLYMVYLLLRYEIFSDQAKTKHGIEYNNELVQFELLHQQEKPQNMGRTVQELFDYLKNNTMGIYLINTVYKEGWKSMSLPQQDAIIKKYLPIFTEKVKAIEDTIEAEIRTNHEVSQSNDELLSIKRGILRILNDMNDQHEAIYKQRPKDVEVSGASPQ